MVFVKKSTFFLYVFFSAKKAKKNHFLIFCIEKNAFQTKKEKFYKILKNRHFAKGLVHGVCQKNKKGRKKHFLIFWIEKKVFWTSKVKFSQSRKKSTFCKGVSPWCSSKNLSFSHWFFWAKKGRKKHFLIFWIEKNAF